MADFISAGFLLIRKIPRPYWVGNLLPDQIISASREICPQFPGSYAIDWAFTSEQEKQQQFERINLPPHLWTQAQEWATSQVDIIFGWPGVFYTLDSAKEAKERFFPTDEHMHIIALGLAEEFVASFLQQAAPPPTQAGYAPIGSTGYYELASKKLSLPKAGKLLGFEPLNTYIGGVEDSWLINDLHRHCAKALNIVPAANGLLSDLQQGRLCCQEISRDEVGAEPGLWLPWALFEYQ